MENIIFTGIIGLVIGMFISFYDKKSGKKLYHKWYNISNKNNLDPKMEIGFVTNQLFGQKLTVALIFTAIAYVVHFFLVGDAFLGLFRMIGFFVGIMIAFYTASLLLSLFSKKISKTIDYIEKVEKGSIDLKAEAKKGFEKAKDKVSEVAEDIKESVTGKEETKEIIEEKTEPTPEKETPKDDKDWRKGVKDFLDK